MTSFLGYNNTQVCNLSLRQQVWYSMLWFWINSLVILLIILSKLLKMFERHHLQILTQRLNEPRKFIQVLMGPRRIGKTTHITQLVENIKISYHFTSADAIAATNSLWLEQQWETARIKMEQQKAEEYLLVIDEIQKIDNWSEAVKLLWDADSRTKKNPYSTLALFLYACGK